MKELHIDLLLGDAPAENIHLLLWRVTLADVLNFVKDFAWFSRTVSLEFDLEVITTEDLNSTFGQLTASCYKLDSLRIKLLTRQAKLNCVYLIGDKAHGSRLKDLELGLSGDLDTKQRVCCDIVDLSCATALTHLRLSGVDHPDTFSLRLPSNLQSFSFSQYYQAAYVNSPCFARPIQPCSGTVIGTVCQLAVSLPIYICVVGVSPQSTCKPG